MGANKPKPDFSGYATKAGIKCSDGRTIMPDAFKHQDTMTVPLVWQHGHSESTNVLGHAILENRKDGVYAYGYFNDTDQGANGRKLVQHGDIVSLSIYANKLLEKGKNVMHGFIREVSLVLSGANPGALIDNVELTHGEDGGYVTLDDEAVIYSGAELEHGDMSSKDEEEIEHEDGDSDRSVQEVYDDMDDDEQAVVHYLVAAALETNGAAHEDDDENNLEHSDEDNEGKEVGRMSRNVFEQQNDGKPVATHSLSHSDVEGILADFKSGGSMRAAIESYALAHGINDIETLFPEAKNVTTTPDFDKRRTEWVASVWNGTKKSPFSRIKNIVADLTFEDARARGYIKGNMKKEEFFGLQARTTGPATVYKKQKLDRDDIIDIVDFDVVIWLWGEMRLMLEEELARAIMIGDGRPVEDPANPGQPNPDKIKDPAGATEGAGIRSILNEDDLYAATVNVNIDDANSDYSEIIDAVTRSQKFYKGSGSPTFYTTQDILTEMLLIRDEIGRRLYRTASELAAELGVSSIVAVEVFDTVPDLVGIIVNLSDYTVGTDKGGEIAKFEDFDIDFNQYKYLIETRLSGALTKIRSALVVRKVAASAALVKPQKPTYDAATGTITPKTTTGVTYKRGDTDATVTTAVPIVLAAGQELTIYSEPASGSYYFADNVTDEWTFEKPAA